MSDTWRKTPKGKKREPRPPEKGGQVNILRDFDLIDKEEWENEDETAEDR